VVVVSNDLHAEAQAVLEAFRLGWVALDAAQVLATFCRESNVVVYGTDRSEEWFGREQLVEPFATMTRIYRNPVYVWGDGEPVIRPFGDGAWAYGFLSVTLEADGQRYDFKMRTTFVLEREAGDLKICHAHCSVGLEDSAAPYSDRAPNGSLP
jgi:ketosteroid isomerase-like protein